MARETFRHCGFCAFVRGGNLNLIRKYPMFALHPPLQKPAKQNKQELDYNFVKAHLSFGFIQ